MFWGSEYRKKAVHDAHLRYIGKSEAIREFKVSEAELLCLKHMLVPNSMNRKCPQQVFWYSAVEALAYRAHGGPIGHREYVKRWQTTNDKNMNTRKKNKERAKNAGTLIEHKRKHRLLPAEWRETEREASATSTGSANKGKGKARETHAGYDDENENEDVEMSKEEDEDHKFCKEGCNCWKDPYKRDLPPRKASPEEGECGSGNNNDDNDDEGEGDDDGSGDDDD
ncbi:hypothetical protein I302_103674 [Kwoniella bestiolae CBS 10118]|uniref:Uncharacterized protein n=1 Tax=Kwoniella bestiolae CBS 10118 TaxID=1296100 RepID=A0A1B9G950_9TREE|nr:hypothetical protein I302_02379 [Kwoniella bestiolae CBS 10118]OCF27537.1 hypothetical protein I302_02379 [Kwoniella bestiolae CBS 10118]